MALRCLASLSLLLLLAIACQSTVSIQFLHVELSKDTLRIGEGVGNSVAVVLGNHLLLATWGEVLVNSSGVLEGIAPIFSRSTKIERVTYDPRLVASFGIESTRSVTYVRWSSNPVRIDNGSASFVWRGGGEVLSIARVGTLLRIWGSIEIQHRGIDLDRVRRHTIIVPLSSLVPSNVEIYAVVEGRLVNATVLKSLASGRFVATPLLVLSMNNVSLVLGGALVEWVEDLGMWRLWLGVTIDQNRSVVSNLIIVVATGIGKDTLLRVVSRCVGVRNPIAAMREVWSALTASSSVKTVVSTTTSIVTTTVVRELRPFEAAAIAMMGMVLGTIMGFLLARRGKS